MLLSWRSRFCVFVLIALSLRLGAQTTTVTATVVDQLGVTWANANGLITFQQTPGVSGPYNWTGGVFDHGPITFTTDASGNFSVVLPQNCTIAPSGSTWSFSLAPNQSTASITVNVPVCGTTMDISNVITANTSNQKVQSMPFPRGYSSNGVQIPPNEGQMFFNTTSKAYQYWANNMWNNIGSGGGVTPAGDFFEVQTNFNNNALGGSQMFTNSAHTANFANSQFGTYGYNSLNPTLLPGCTAIAVLCNAITQYTQDIVNPIRVTGTAPNQQFAFGQSFSAQNTYNFVGPGIDNGTNPQFTMPGSTVNKGPVFLSHFFMPGISQVMSGNTLKYSESDFASLYFYVHAKGANVKSGDEGVTNFASNAEYNTATNIFTGVITGVTTDQVNTKLSFNLNATTTTDAPGIGDSFYIFNSTNAPDVTGNACSYNGSTHIITACPGTTFVPATARGTNVAQFQIVPSNPYYGTSVVVTVNVSSGTFSPGPVRAGCPGSSSGSLDFGQITQVTAPVGGQQTLTVNLLRGKAAGCKFVQGGTHGIFDMPFDHNSNNVNHKTTWYVWDALDTSTIEEFNEFSGGRAVIQPWRHNFGSATAISLTRTGNVVTAQLNQNSWQYTGMPITITGATDSSFNGSFTVNTGVDTTGHISWPQTGANGQTTATINVGGAIGGSSGPGAFNIWNAANVAVAYSNTTTNPSTHVTTADCCLAIGLRPNDITWNVGNTMNENPSMYAIVLPASFRGTYDVPAPVAGVQNWIRTSVTGNGVNNAFASLNVENDQPFTDYQGVANGKQTGPVGIRMQGAYGTGWLFNSPLPNADIIHISNSSALGAGGLYYNYNIIRADNPSSGNGAATWSFNPNSGVSTIISGLGVGLISQSQIIIGPNGITLGASPSGSINLQSLDATPVGTITRQLDISSAGTSGVVTAGKANRVVSNPGCAIASPAIGASCTTSMTVPNLDPSVGTNYAITGCTVTNPAGGPSVIGGVVVASGSAFSVTQVGLSASATGGGTINCYYSSNQ